MNCTDCGGNLIDNTTIDGKVYCVNCDVEWVTFNDLPTRLEGSE